MCKDLFRTQGLSLHLSVLKYLKTENCRLDLPQPVSETVLKVADKGYD